MTTLNAVWWSMAPFGWSAWAAMLYTGLFAFVLAVLRGAAEDDDR